MSMATRNTRAFDDLPGVKPDMDVSLEFTSQAKAKGPVMTLSVAGLEP